MTSKIICYANSSDDQVDIDCPNCGGPATYGDGGVNCPNCDKYPA